MTLVTWFAMFCWAVHIGQWTIRWVLRRLTTHQLHNGRDDFLDELNTNDLPMSSVRNCSYGLHKTGLHPTWYNEVEDDVETTARMQIVRLENRMEDEIIALKTENSKLNSENICERINHLECRIDSFYDDMSATENSKIVTENICLRMAKLEGHMEKLHNVLFPNHHLKDLKMEYSKLETEKIQLRINEFDDRIDHFCDEMTALKKENSKLLSTITAMTKCKQTLTERIDLLHEYVTTSSKQVASWIEKYNILENRMNMFENQSVNVKCVQAQNEKIDLLHKYTTASCDRVASLADKYETLKNRIDSVETKSVNTTCVQALNKRIDMIQLAQMVNTKCVQALGEKIDLLHKYIKTSKNGLMSLADKFVTLENQIDTVETKSMNTTCVQALNKRIDMIHLAQSVSTKCVQALGEKINLLHKYTKTSKDGLMSLADKFVTLENQINTVENQSVKTNCLQLLDKKSDRVQHNATTSDQTTSIKNKKAKYNSCNRSMYWADNNETTENRIECFLNNYEFTPVVSSSHSVELKNDDSGIFSVSGPILSKNDEFSLKYISSNKGISNNLSNVKEMRIVLSTLSIDLLGMSFTRIDEMKISPSIHPELFGNNKPEIDGNLSSLKLGAGEYISLKKWVSRNLSDDDQPENNDICVLQNDELNVRSSK